MLNIVLVCGSGASSGFMAQQIKKAAKKRGIELEITARSESILESFLENTDIVLVAPHLKAEGESISKRCAAFDVPSVVIDNMIYGTLDGNKALNLITSTLGIG